jgi:hypothetical protein
MSVVAASFWNMDDIIYTIFAVLLVLLVLGVAIFALFFAISLFSALTSSKPISRPTVQEDTTMNEGDFHSGPGGYSPNTSYPDTFYGSGGHDEGDFNR